MTFDGDSRVAPDLFGARQGLGSSQTRALGVYWMWEIDEKGELPTS